MTQTTTDPRVTADAANAQVTMRGRREELGLTLRDLAAECRRQGAPISNSQLSKIERGVTETPRPAVRAALRRILGIDPVTGRRA